MTTPEALSIARRVFPDVPDTYGGYTDLMRKCWDCPSYPIFWQTDDPDAELEAQLEQLREQKPA